ncbi:hypothetical protein ACFL2O_09575 [Thermodesulfobacteriota bacterium]
MNVRKSNICLRGFLIAILLIFMFSGCAKSPKTFDPGMKGPQVMVQPEAVSLGVVALAKTPIVFKGKGFEPGDSIFISLLNVKKGDKSVNLPIADGEVDKNGNFTAPVGTISKVSDILNAKIGSNKKLETIIIVSQPTIPAGTYTAKATSLDSDKTATCKIRFKEPLLFDAIMDMLGSLSGKVVKK